MLSHGQKVKLIVTMQQETTNRRAVMVAMNMLSDMGWDVEALILLENRLKQIPNQDAYYIFRDMIQALPENPIGCIDE